MRKVTITDIANELGCSPSTVSRALRNKEKVSAETYAAVSKLAKKYGYRPNPNATGLVNNRTRLLGVVVQHLEHSYFVKVLEGILATCQAKDYQVITCISHGSYEKEKQLLSQLYNQCVDGILASHSHETKNFSHFQEIIDASIPMVFFDRFIEEIDTQCVISDDFDGAKEAVEYLISNGRRKIAHLMGPEHLSVSYYRYLGYREALKEAGLPHDQDLVYVMLDEHGKDIANKELFLQKILEIDAVITFNDSSAFEVYKLVRQMGRSIPEDVAVIGFSDDPIAQYLTPQLTTVRQPAFKIGQRAAEVLIHKIERNQEEEIFPSSLPQETASTIVLKNDLIIREST
ncbi:MAG: LacI family DNA-binding transcriptional regulator [Bacteroidota bacterium]